MRNYRSEYDRYHGTPRQKRRRAARNRARYWARKQGKVRKGDGKDVHHRDNNPENNGGKNLAVTSIAKNRGYPRDRNNKPKKGLSRLSELIDRVYELRTLLK